MEKAGKESHGSNFAAACGHSKWFLRSVPGCFNACPSFIMGGGPAVLFFSVPCGLDGVLGLLRSLPILLGRGKEEIYH
jgi:hypothetical protein